LKTLKIQIVAIALLFGALNLNAQVKRSDIDLGQAKKGRRIQYFPFDKIQVLDNRFDTSCIYTEETGVYPPHTVSFTEPAASAIEKYIYRLVSKSKKGNKELLFNIEQLQIPNVLYSLKRFKARKLKIIGVKKRRDGIGTYDIRTRLLFEATAWYKNEEGRYNKFLTIKREYFYSGYDYLQRGMRHMLNECMQVAAILSADTAIEVAMLPRHVRKLLNDTATFRFSNDENNVPLEQINVNAREKWKNYPIYKDSSIATGIFPLFDDFKYNQVSPAHVAMAFNEKDSLYYLAAGTDSFVHTSPHWAIADGTNWYIKLGDSSYLKLNKANNTFNFYIPANLPDMYALLSIQENHIDGASTTIPSSGNLLVAIVGSLISSTINESITKSANRSMTKRLTEEGLKHNYRYCFINMSSGDIVYHDK